MNKVPLLSRVLMGMVLCDLLEMVVVVDEGGGKGREGERVAVKFPFSSSCT